MSEMKAQLNRQSKTPLYAQLKDILRARIQANEFVEGDLLPSINDLCSEYDVSTITVRQALELLANEGLIGKRPGWGTFVKTVASTREEVRRPSVLLLDHRGVPMWDEFSFGIKREVEQSINRAGFALQYGPTDPKWLEEFMLQHAEEACAIILLSGSYRFLKQFIDEYNLPVAVMSRDPATIDTAHVKDVVNVMGYEAMIDLVNYLVGLGHRRIATITLQRDSFAGEGRFQGYKDAMEAAGLGVKREYVVEGGFCVSDGKRAACSLLDLDELPTAIICANDYLALGAMSEITCRGLRIPQDISVTGFDDIEMSAHVHPPLTTMALDRELVGATIARLVIERLANPKKAFTVERIPTTMVERQSCARVVSAGAVLANATSGAGVREEVTIG